ncbi:MAG: hypothetical protein LDL33_10280, partial [Desulfomonile sp.]|nr:hypothetical protein [Desulfomonile sp.]
VRVQVHAHPVYNMLNRVDPSLAPAEDKANVPASCWHCPMPGWFAKKFCPEYHAEKARLTASAVGNSHHPFDSGIRILHHPGHAPDALTIVIDGEAVLVGDTALPDITPHPTREHFFELTKGVLADGYVEAQQLYGLRTYIRSLKKLRKLAQEQSNTILLPGHRLFYRAQWNQLDLAARVDELIEHHIRRCSDILDLLADSPRTAEEVATAYFEAGLLEGFGINLATNEILSHCELMEITGDVVFDGDGRFVATGHRRFESFINELS